MIKEFVKTLLYQEKASSERFVAYLRREGVSVGENVTFYSPPHTMVDLSAPFLLSIGSNVEITHGVMILTHDYSWSVLKGCSGAVCGAQSPVTIGNNVFIGRNAIITRGVTIGDNVIIGAGSVVTKDCESGGVYAGNPAHRLMTIEEFHTKRKAKQFDEARIMVRLYRQRCGTMPPREVLREYFMLFCTPEDAKSIHILQIAKKSHLHRLSRS